MPLEVIKMRKGDTLNLKALDVFSMSMIIHFVWSNNILLFNELIKVYKEEGKWEYLIAVDQSIEEGERPTFPENMPRSIKDVVNDMWCKEPEERPEMLEVYNRLDELNKNHDK